jgi:hypothetical protein
MTKKITLGEASIDADWLVRTVRLGLLSSDQEVVQTQRDTIAAFESIRSAIAALSAYDGIREWINDNKPLGDLQKIVKKAEKAVNANPSDFTANWVLAICYKYARKYQKSHNSYKDADAYCTTVADRQDLYADWAELYVYTGDPGTAKTLIEGADSTVRWHPWAYAFVLHQYAYAMDPGNTTTDTQWYELSNQVLQSWPDFDANPDALILVAANCGGIARRRKVTLDPNSPEMVDAANALAAFINRFPNWSLKREKRGPFIKNEALMNDPVTMAEIDLLRVNRKAYAKHYFDNLRVGRKAATDLPDKGTGDQDPPDDPET